MDYTLREMNLRIKALHFKKNKINKHARRTNNIDFYYENFK